MSARQLIEGDDFAPDRPDYGAGREALPFAVGQRVILTKDIATYGGIEFEKGTIFVVVTGTIGMFTLEFQTSEPPYDGISCHVNQAKEIFMPADKPHIQRLARETLKEDDDWIKPGMWVKSRCDFWVLDRKYPAGSLFKVGHVEPANARLTVSVTKHIWFRGLDNSDINASIDFFREKFVPAEKPDIRKTAKEVLGEAVKVHVGQLWRSKREISTVSHHFPAGTVFSVSHVFSSPMKPGCQLTKLGTGWFVYEPVDDEEYFNGTFELAKRQDVQQLAKKTLGEDTKLFRMKKGDVIKSVHHAFGAPAGALFIVDSDVYSYRNYLGAVVYSVQVGPLNGEPYEYRYVSTDWVNDNFVKASKDDLRQAAKQTLGEDDQDNPIKIGQSYVRKDDRDNTHTKAGMLVIITDIARDGNYIYYDVPEQKTTGRNCGLRQFKVWFELAKKPNITKAARHVLGEANPRKGHYPVAIGDFVKLTADLTEETANYDKNVTVGRGENIACRAFAAGTVFEVHSLAPYGTTIAQVEDQDTWLNMTWTFFRKYFKKAARSDIQGYAKRVLSKDVVEALADAAKEGDYVRLDNPVAMGLCDTARAASWRPGTLFQVAGVSPTGHYHYSYDLVEVGEGGMLEGVEYGFTTYELAHYFTKVDKFAVRDLAKERLS